MNAAKLFRPLCHIKSILFTNSASINTCNTNFAAVKKTTSAAGGVMGLGKGKKKVKLGVMEKKELPVETDPARLVTYVCGSNINVTGEDVKLAADSEYPAWLWELRTGAPARLEELDPTSKRYWLRVRAAGMRRNNKLRAQRRF